MWNIANNCGFIHRSMKFGTCLDHGPGELFSYGATGSKTCVKLAAIFQNGIQYALVTWETSTPKAIQDSYWPCIALLSNLKQPQHVTNSICGCLCSCRHSKLCWLSKIAPQKVYRYHHNQLCADVFESINLFGIILLLMRELTQPNYIMMLQNADCF